MEESEGVPVSDDITSSMHYDTSNSMTFGKSSAIGAVVCQFGDSLAVKIILVSISVLFLTIWKLSRISLFKTMQIPPKKSIQHEIKESIVEALEECDPSKYAVGTMKVDLTEIDIEWVNKRFSSASGGHVKAGGYYTPLHCHSSVKTAIIVPYRKRPHQLTVFLRHMHEFLKIQMIEYQIFIVEQVAATPFNRASLLNIGFDYSSKLKTGFNCFILHDVDLLPERFENIYNCNHSPQHMSAAIDIFNYSLPYEDIFGGVEGFKKKDFLKVNGFSNMFWGWGGEDDDMYRRIKTNNLQVGRLPLDFSRYQMNKHQHFLSDGKNKNRMTLLLNGHQRFWWDGLTNLRYQLLTVDEYPLYTLLKVHTSPKMYEDLVQKFNLKI